MPTPTPEQAAILECAANTNSHIIIDAKAGSGKTTTLLDALGKLRGTVQLQAFNKSIATELQDKANSKLSFERRLDISIGTCHSFGLASYRAASKLGRSLRIDGGKLNFLYKDRFLKNAPDAEFRRLSKVSYPIRQLVGAAKSNGFGLTGPEFQPIDSTLAWEEILAHYSIDRDLEKAGFPLEEAIEMAQTLLRLSNATTKLIDFDDMIYLPLLFNYSLQTYDNILIDEAQDISATRRELAFRSLAKNGRVIAVGDPHQAIYGFTGADAYSLANIARRCENMGPTQHFPLSICWRCDAEIIASAQKQVPGIYARPDAPSGVVDNISLDSDFSPLAKAAKPGDAILCRLNRPCVAAALALMLADIPCKIEGRDIGARLLGHAKRAAPFYANAKLPEIEHAVESWAEAETQALAAKGRGAQAALLQDEIDCLFLLISKCIDEGKQAWTDLENLVKVLFADDIPPARLVTLSSVHKSKGREWPRVFILGPSDYMPFFLAEQEWELEQEDNLIYVAKTRAEHHLTFVNGVKSILDKRAHQ